MKRNKLLFILLILIVIFFSTLRFSHLKTYLKTFQEKIFEIKDIVDKNPFYGITIFLGVSSFLIILGIPKSIICASAGIMFGFWKGLLLASLSITIGSFIIFLIARLIGAPFFYEKVRKYLPLIERNKGNQLILVLLIKQLPIPCFLNNTLLGIAPISPFTFLIGSFLGQLPTNLIFTLYGSSVHGYIVLKVSIASIIAILVFLFLRHIRKHLLKDID